jgi:hypothetical protein
MSNEENNKEKKKIGGIEVSIDTARTEALARENERLKMEKEKQNPENDLAEENEYLKTTLQLLSEKEAIKRCDELGIRDKALRDDFITHPEKISAYAKGLKKEGQSAPAGTAPLNSAQWGENGQPSTYDAHGNLMNKKYSSYQAMLEDLHDREAVFQGSQKGLEATKMLEALTRKFFEEHKQANSPVPILIKPMPKLISVNGLLVPEDPSMGDLQERNRIFRRRKLLEREERGSVAVKGEDKP